LFGGGIKLYLFLYIINLTCVCRSLFYHNLR